MTKVLVVGCGDLGGEIAQLLAAAAYEVVGVRVSDKPLSNHLRCIQADVTKVASLVPLEGVNPNVIVYCVAANEQTDESYQAHYVEGLKNVLTTQAANPNLEHVFFISSTRVYGQTSNQILDEAVIPMPSDFGGERLLEAEGLLRSLQCAATAIRFSGIYGPGRLYMINMAKDPNRWSKINKWTNRIHRDDAASFVVFLCEKVIAGEVVEDCYIGTDDRPTLQHDVLAWLGKKLDIITPVLDCNLLINGSRLGNMRMRASGYQLKYANYQLGYGEILKNEVLNNA
ncbi:MAG: NAD-dependent epimerase/dehydratase family protein [Methylophilaceae bacterium]